MRYSILKADLRYIIDILKNVKNRSYNEFCIKYFFVYKKTLQFLSMYFGSDSGTCPP